jgi:prepilin-type N-terminal cleavage/methylation domain-containing protein
MPKLVRGFTLIEVLVIIAIIGILSAIMYNSFSGAKTKSRDNKRIADISLIRLSLEQYYSKFHFYPLVLNDSTFVPAYLNSLPQDPTAGASYGYLPMTRVTDSSYCTYYQLWAQLESSSSYLSTKKGFNSKLITDRSDVNGFFRCQGSSMSGIDATAENIYDVIPQ